MKDKPDFKRHHVLVQVPGGNVTTDIKYSRRDVIIKHEIISDGTHFLHTPSGAVICIIGDTVELFYDEVALTPYASFDLAHSRRADRRFVIGKGSLGNNRCLGEVLQEDSPPAQ